MCIVCMKLLHGLLYLYNGFHKPKNRRICIPSQSGKGHTCRPPSHTTVMNYLAIPSCKDRKHSQEKSFKTLLLQVLKEGGNHLPSSTGIIIIIINNTQTSSSLPRESHLHSMLINPIAGLNIACLFTLSAYVCVGVCEELQKSFAKSE